MNGELLIGHWRVEPGAGINVRKLFEDPPAVDLVSWVQGHGLLPYIERGPLVSGASLVRFESMFAGNALVFMVLLN